MQDCVRLFREEQDLAALGVAGETVDLTEIYGKRQERLEAMAARVVTIHACGGMGSGVMLDSDGYIATNAHVISSSNGVCREIVVTARGWQAVGRLVVGEYEQDLAIIRVEDAETSGVEIAPEIFLGQDVFAVGHPLGQQHTVTRGIISYPRRIVNQRPYIQTDASINPGNSGGGLFDELGRLVGLPTFKEVWADRNMTIPVANIGFAVPGDVVQDYYLRVRRRGVNLRCSGDPHSARQAVIIA